MSDVYFPDASLELETVEPGLIDRKIRAKGGRMMMVEVFFKAGAIGAEHRHPHEQLTYCLSGEFVFNVEGETSTRPRSSSASSSSCLGRPRASRPGIWLLMWRTTMATSPRW